MIAECVHGGARCVLRAGSIAVAILRPGERFGSGPVPNDKDEAILVRSKRAGDIRLDADDLAPGTIVWIVDRSQGPEDGRYTAWPMRMIAQ